MERLIRRLHDAESALALLDEVLANERPTDIERDAAIKRFELTIEAVWNAAQRYLADTEHIEAGSPGAVIRACRETGMGGEYAAEARLEVAKDRKLISHMYRGAAAEVIFARLPGHRDALAAWFADIAARRTGAPHDMSRHSRVRGDWRVSAIVRRGTVIRPALSPYSEPPAL